MITKVGDEGNDTRDGTLELKEVESCAGCKMDVGHSNSSCSHIHTLYMSLSC